AALPRFNGNVWTQHLYWQLTVPSNRHLIDASRELTPEFVWRWNGLGWERQPVKEQSELEAWSGAEPNALSPESMNRYLFSIAGNPGQIEVITAGRGELVFVVSLIVWAYGLLLIYVRALRSPTALFLTGVLLVALAAWQTSSSLLFLQAAALGLAMVALAMLLELFQARRRSSPRIVRSAGSSIVNSRTASTSIRTPAPIAPASTESLPGEVEMPVHESTHR